MSVAGSAGCVSCGGMPADMHLGTEGPLCDRCFDDRISAGTGLPRLPDVPPPVAITGADGSSRTMIYRLSRGPAGISARMAEQDPPPDGGYESEEFGDHDADPTMLLDLVTARARTEMARRSLTRNGSGRWEICHEEGRLADEVVGRIETVPPFGALRLVVDGHAVSWGELGQALSPYEGWQFALRITDRFGDPRL
jgi:hypothetical protein